MALDPALRMAAARLGGPLGDEIGATLDMQALGTPRRDAYRALADRVGSDDVARLVAALEAALRSHDFRLEDRAWRPHVTLLRDAQAPRDAAQPALQWAVGDFVLVESLRGEYRLLDRWPLGGVPPG